MARRPGADRRHRPGPARTGTALAAVAAVLAGGLTVLAPPAAAGPSAAAVIPTGEIWGIDFAGGTLNTVERAANGESWLMARQVSPDGTAVSAPVHWQFGGAFANGARIQRVPCDAGECALLTATGNGDVGYVFESGGTQRVRIQTTPDTHHGTEPAVTGARVVDAAGRHFAYDAASTGKQYVDVVPRYFTKDVRITRPVTAASVWGTRLWAPGTAKGSVTATDIETGKVAQTVATGAPCTVRELRAMGRWLYWNCGPSGAAGVYDLTARKNITVPSGPALVGDGYLVRHDRAAGKLMLTDYHTGTAAAPRAVADLPAGGTADQRRLTWAVDRFGGDIAYADGEGNVRVVPSGVPAQPLARIAAELDDGYVDSRDNPWTSVWQFNKPVSWTFTVKDAATGRTVRTLGGTGGTEADVSWNGKDSTGAHPYNGPHTWTLKATALDGGGTWTGSGTVALSGGRPGHHDQGGHRWGELATLDSSGRLTLHSSAGKGTFDGKKTASGWPKGTAAVPFGDMTGDRCAELLARMPDGELRRYQGRCGESYAPSHSHISLGKGWKAYDVLTSPGDMTGDGRADLVVRETATGVLHLFPDAGNGKLGARKRIGPGWNQFTHLAGTGDLNGDGVGDLVARGKDGTLSRYDGKADGTFKTRVRIAANWGKTYNSVVGIGDITGDGRTDLLARDTSGALYRQPGKGDGTFGSPVRVSTGWQGYQGLY